MDRADLSTEPSDFSWMVVMSLVFFALVAIALWREYATQWRPYQKQFRVVLEQNAKFEAVRKFHPEIRQIWIPELGLVDRCITCHLGYQWSGVLPAGLAEPLTPHPALPFMAPHPFEKFGCTTCHAGQGWATTVYGAHDGGPGWDEPMLSRQLAQSDGLTEAELIQMRCNFCHRRDQSTPGMEEINLAKPLIKKKKCLVCHSIEGRGGHTAPDLTYEGDKDPELFDFSHVTGARTLFNWQVEHLIEAGKVSPRTAMPDFHLPPEQARALALLLLSWKKLNYPPQYIPPSDIPPSASATH
ncbi:MAG TPA: c-type cytochrome [Candidatus Binataceae bacterium]